MRLAKNVLNQIIKDGSAINPECLIGFNIKDLPIKKHEFRMWPYRYMLMQLENIKNEIARLILLARQSWYNKKIIDGMLYKREAEKLTQSISTYII